MTREQKARAIQDTIGTVSTLIVPVPLLQSILNYLQQRPYAEVAQLIQEIMSIPPNDPELESIATDNGEVR